MPYPTALSDKETVKVSPAVLLADMTPYLAAFNRWRLLPGFDPSEAQTSPAEEAMMLRMEHAFLEGELSCVHEQASQAPRNTEEFLGWLTDLEQRGPGQRDPLLDWIADSATKEEVRWFLAQELASAAGFEDLLALTQVRMPLRVKLEIARSYWGEMGEGQASATHAPMLARLAADLGIAPGDIDVVWESSALANLMTGLAVHRRHAFRSIGALSIVELTAPARARCLNEGLKRLGVKSEARRYYASRASADGKPAGEWGREVIGPLVARDSRLAQPIAEGALARLAASARCLLRYNQVLGRLAA